MTPRVKLDKGALRPTLGLRETASTFSPRFVRTYLGFFLLRVNGRCKRPLVYNLEKSNLILTTLNKTPLEK